MEHSFSVEVAKQVGVSCATMLRHIVFWVMKNRYNETNFHNGKNWTYNSAKAWSQHFPYWTEKQIRTILTKLSENGFIEIENLNSDKMNHTNWYTITDKTLSIRVSIILLVVIQMKLLEKLTLSLVSIMKL
jgi:hypothetical protein